MYQLRGKLSIVMPAYNEEALIYNSIMQTLSIVEQFAPDLEILPSMTAVRIRQSRKLSVPYAMMRNSRTRLCRHAGVRHTHKAGDIQ